MKRLWMICLLALGLHAGPAAADPRIPAVDEVADELIAGRPGGLAILVLEKGEVIHRGLYGFADAERRVPVTPKTRFHFGSIGKQFTVLALLQLAAAGKLALDDPIARHLPELKALPPGVTIRRMLGHTSGMPSYYPGEAAAPSLAAAMARGGRQVPTAADQLEAVAKTPLQEAPGTAYRYNDTPYEILAILIERLSGETYQDYVEKRLFAPLGMNTAFALPDRKAQQRPDVATGFYGEEPGTYRPVNLDTDPLRSVFEGVSGAGTFYASLDDLERYARAWQGGMPIVAASLTAQMLVPQRLSNGASIPYGLAMALDRHPPALLKGRGLERHGHSGGWPGFVSHFMLVPEPKLAVIVLQSRFNFHDAVAIWGEPAETLLKDRAKLFATPELMAEKVAVAALDRNRTR